METVAGFRSPEEAALDLELPLLGVLVPPPRAEGPVAAAWPEGEELRRDVARLSQRILAAPLAEEGCVGILGAAAPAQRAVVAAAVAAAIAAERVAVLVDADLRHAYLSFDDRRRAQEGIVDVLRYGVRSPRVVAPTATPGLALLPVGSRTVDLPGTFGAEAVPALFAELRRGGEFLVVNGPDLADLQGALPFLDQVPSWVILFELGTSEAERMRLLRDRLGRDRCMGIVALGEVRAEVTTPAPAEAPPASEQELPWEETPAEPAAPPREVAVLQVDEVPVDEAPVAEAPVEEAEEELAEEPEAAPRLDQPTPMRARRPRGLLIGLAGLLVVAIAGAMWFGPKRASQPTGPSEDLAPQTSTTPAQEPGTSGEASHQTSQQGSEDASEFPSVALPETESPTSTPSASPASPPTTTPAEPSPSKDLAASPPPASSGTQDASPAETPPPPAPVTKPATETSATRAPLGDVVWGVHVSSVKNRAGALQEAQRLAVNGRETFVKQTEVPGKGTWWRVYVGPFGTRAEADRTAATLRGAGEDAQVYRLARAEIEAATGREDR